MTVQNIRVFLSAFLMTAVLFCANAKVKAADIYATTTKTVTTNEAPAAVETEVEINDEMNVDVPVAAASVATTNTLPSLSELKTFDLDMFQGAYALHDHRFMRTELKVYLMEELQNDSTLQYQSPGQGRIHLSCRGVKCQFLNVSITDGPKGPEVWRGYVTNYALGIPYYNLGSSRRTAEAITKKIAKEYRKDLMRSAAVPTLP